MKGSAAAVATLWLSLALSAQAQESVESRMKRFEERLEELAAENAALKVQNQKPPKKAEPPGVLQLGEVKLRLTGYLDVGFFKAFGDGVAYRFDAGKRNHPDLRNIPWVFDGDPWANAVNSQGDSADLGLDRTNIARFDPIHSKGRPTFLVNTVNLGLVGSLAESLLFETSINFEPRQGLLGAAGDFLNVDLAYVEWIPSTALDLHIFAGKFESTFGIEYRQRKASDRFNITPSIISRYSVGTPIGLKVRGSILNQLLGFNFALTNGAMMTEQFGHFYNELDANFVKTGSGRLSSKLPLPFFLEVGVSGLIGAQDGQPDDTRVQTQYGVDLKLVWEDLTLRGEYVRAFAPGGGISAAPRLTAEGFYVDAWYQLTSLIGAYVRVDLRDARLFADTNMYISRVMRFTGAIRFDLNFHLAVKLEYLRLQELKGPEIEDDVFTSSLVFKF